MTSKCLVLVIGFVSWLLLSSDFGYGAQSDVNCLRSIQNSLQDPLNSLNNWNFNNNTDGFICRFIGIECWHENENRVLNIRLSDMGLKGSFPRGVGDCESMTGLDLSSNDIDGTIPSDISILLQFVTTLDLSSNKLSGQIPVNLANCSYLNVLKLDKNQLSGQIPPEFALLGRIKTFSVTNNRLTGQVPQFNSNISITADSYSGNPGLCGNPLPPCRGSSKKSRTGVVAGAAIGGVILAALVVGFVLLFFLRRVSRKKKEDDPEGNRWAKNLKGAKGVQVRQLKSFW